MKNYLEKVAFEKLFSTWDQSFVNSPKGAEAVGEVLYQRQRRAETYAVKWLNQFLPLRDAAVVEVGCGTGAASIPLARICKRLVGLDIDSNSIEVAKARAEYCGARDNVEFLTVAPEQLLEKADGGREHPRQDSGQRQNNGSFLSHLSSLIFFTFPAFRLAS